MTRPIIPAYARYGLLVLFVPVGIAGLLFALEARRAVRLALVSAICAWGIAPAADHLALLRSYAGPDRPNDFRVLADELVAREVDVAATGYWRAYKLTYLTGERVKVASTDFIRILEYQDLAARAGADLIEIREAPCPGGERILAWYLCRPGS